MKIREALDIFDLIWEKYTDEGITDQEKCRHINTAQKMVMLRNLYSRYVKRSEYQEPPFGFENTQYDSERMKPFIVHMPDDGDPILQTDGDGVLTYDQIRSYFPQNLIYNEGGLVESRQCEIYHIGNLAVYDATRDKYQPAKWVRHNEIERVHHDPFREPTERWPVFVNQDTFIQIWPQSNKDVRLTAIREPKHVWWEDGDETLQIDPEWPDSGMYDVLFEACKLAGLNIKDYQFYQAVGREENMK